MTTVLAYALMIPVMLIALCLEAKNRLRDLDSRFTAWAYRPEQRKAWRLFSRLGDGWLYVAFWLWLFATGDLERYNLAQEIFVAWGLGAAMKLAIRRKRRVPTARLRWVRFGRGQDRMLNLYSWSFPSQHAACATAFACAMWPIVGAPWCVFPVAFALLVCSSRVLIGAHYLSDVLAGVGVGLLAWRLA
jgi:membrane-associated phospholipid phosphatase